MAKKTNDGIPQDVKTVLFWGLGIGILGLALLILVIIFGNLSGNTGFSPDSLTITVTNEEDAYLNGTEYTLSGYNTTWSSITATGVWNTSDGSVIASANYTLSSVGVLINATASNFNPVNLSYTYAHSYRGSAEVDAENIILNYTASAVNTAKQFPVTGTILGIALLLAILIGVLVFAIRRMMGVAVTDGKSSSSSGSFDRGGFG